MLRIAILSAITLLTAARALHAQDRGADVPPIPRQERFTPRSDLTATLRLSTDRVRVDELPKATLVLKNVGARRLLIRKSWADAVWLNPVVRVYTSSGERLEGLTSNCRCIHTPARLPDITVALEPQQEYEIALTIPEVGLPTTQPLLAEIAIGFIFARPPGDYVVRATYSNAPDFWYGIYDVYEPGADRAWEGVIETPPVGFKVLPLDEDATQELVAAIDGDGNADAAIRRAWHSGDPRTAGALVRRFQRDSASRALILAALHAIADVKAIDRLLEWIDAALVRAQLTRDWRVSSLLTLVVRLGSGCRGRTFLDGLPIRQFVTRCPEFAEEARSALRAPDDPTFSDAAFEAFQMRRRSAIGTLEAVGDPVDIPLLAAVTRGIEPALRLQSPRGRWAWEDLERRALSALRRLAVERTERVLQEHLSVDGMAKALFLDDVRKAISELAADDLQRLALEAIDGTPAVAVQSATRLREAYVAERPVEAAPVLRAADVTPPTDVTEPPARREMVARLFSDRPDMQIQALYFFIEHGDGSLSLRFADLVTSTNDNVQARAIDAIARHGTASAFIPLRNALVLRPPDTVGSLDSALRALTFRDLPRGRLGDLEEWDAWWRRNRELTRRQWAEHAIADARPDPTRPYEYMGAVKAVEYLAALPKPPYRVLERATQSRAWQVRIAAATALAARDKHYGMRLLARELLNRNLGACWSAVETLKTLTNLVHVNSCYEADRLGEVDFWNRQITEAAPTTAR